MCKNKKIFSMSGYANMLDKEGKIMFRKIIKVFKNPTYIILPILNLGISRLIPDKLFLKVKYKLIVKKRLNLKNPQTFNEKIQWLKIYDRRPEYKNMVDKYEVRKYITEKIGEEYLIPILGVYNSYDEIDFDNLPNQFVLKPNHTSGDIFICKDKSKIDHSKLKQEISMWLKKKYYWVHREWPYKNVKPRIICEKYMSDESGTELKDYKIHCFNGVPKLVQVDFGRFSNHRRNLYDTNWNYINASILYPSDSNVFIEKPICLEKMLEIASSLSKNFRYLRVDLYVIKAKIYFGELTFHHGAGYEPFSPKELEYLMGEWINL